MAVAATVPAEKAPGVALLSAAYPVASVSRLPASSETAPRVCHTLQMPFQGCADVGPLRDAVPLRHICFAQRGNPRVGQDVFQQRIRGAGTALLRIGEFQQLGIEEPVQFLVEGRRQPPRHPMQPSGGVVRSGLVQEIRGDLPERHGHTPHQVDGMLIYIPAEGLPVQGERPTDGKMPVDEHGNAGSA
jgi:hypothetical protein